MKRAFVAIFLLLLGTAGCGKNFEWFPGYENYSGGNGGGSATDLTSLYTATTFANVSGAGITATGYLPTGIAVDTGRSAVYVADDANNRILKFNVNGAFDSVFKAGVSSSTTGGIAVDSAGNVYLADALAREVLLFNQGGGELTPVDVGLGTDIGDIAVTSDSTYVFVTMPSDDKVRKISISSGEPFDINQAFSTPSGIAVSTDTVYISNNGSGKITVTDMAGYARNTGSFGSLGSGTGQLYKPLGIALYGGNIYVVDSGNKRIQVYNSSWQYQGYIGKAGTALGEFTKPLAIAADTTGNLYVAETNKVHKFTRK